MDKSILVSGKQAQLQRNLPVFCSYFYYVTKAVRNFSWGQDLFELGGAQVHGKREDKSQKSL